MEDLTASIIQTLVSSDGKLFIAVISLTIIVLAFLYSFLTGDRSASQNVGAPEHSQQSHPLENSSTQENIAEKPLGSVTSINQGLLSSRKSLWHKLTSLIKDKQKNSDDFFISFEELLIESDLGVKTSIKLINEIKNSIDKDKPSEELSSLIQEALKKRIVNILDSSEDPEIEPVKVSGCPKIVMVVGVNGAGKTTTIGKLAFQFRARGSKVLLAACDTFRAAATDQLEVWSERSGSLIEKGKDGEKPSTVAYRAIHRAVEENVDVVLIDTAGRLHTKINLMNELSSVTNIISRECAGAPHETILVLDGSTGQNALQQAKEFNAATKLSGIIITKLDGTQKGGIVVAIKDELQIPVRYLGIGEGVGDLRPFDSREFTEALLGNFDLASDEVLIDVSSADSENLKVMVNASSLE